LVRSQELVKEEYLRVREDMLHKAHQIAMNPVTEVLLDLVMSMEVVPLNLVIFMEVVRLELGIIMEVIQLDLAIFTRIILNIRNIIAIITVTIMNIMNTTDTTIITSITDISSRIILERFLYSCVNNNTILIKKYSSFPK